MYNRSHGRRRPPTVPQNYSGNAFYRVPYEEKPPTEVECREISMAPEECDTEQALPSCQDCSCEHECECERKQEAPSPPPCPSKSPLPFLGGKLFPRGLGNEELLILALILMISGNDDCYDLLICLVLLLFC